MHKKKLQQFLVDVWFTNAISNHGPNRHESSCASILAACAKCLNLHESICASLFAARAKYLSHEPGCVSLLAARAKSRSEVQHHVKFIVELVSEGAWNALNTLQTFAEGDQAAPQNAKMPTSKPQTAFDKELRPISTTIISAG